MSDPGSATGPASTPPCRAYVIGDHARSLRRRVLVAFGIALVIALIVPPSIRALLGPPASGSPAIDLLVRLLDVAGFAAAYLVTLWLAVGPRRLAAMEILVWGSRYATAGYSAVTGIRDPTDAAAAAEWLRTHLAGDDEGPEARYWRAYAHLVAGETQGARSIGAGLRGVEGYEFALASLEGQIALAEGLEPDLEAVATAAERSPDPLGRAVAMANLGALRAQRAFVCGEDDVAAALSVRSDIGGRASRYFLIRVWIPIIALTVGALLLAQVIGT